MKAKKNNDTFQLQLSAFQPFVYCVHNSSSGSTSTEPTYSYFRLLYPR